MEVVDSLPVEARGGIELQHIVLPGSQLLEGIVSEGEVEGVLDLVVYLFAQCT
jgi:hypothetical protein